MKKLVNRLIKFTHFLVKVTRRARIPFFSCRKSKHIYKQYQHIAVLGLMKYLRTDYRGVIERLEVMPEIVKVIGLNQLPHFTTIHKFLQRFNRYRFNRILYQTINLFETGNCILAIDATGYSTNYASTYYSLWVKKWITRRSFIYSSITVDTGNLLIASQHSRRGPGSDNIFFGMLVQQASRKLHIDYVVADKGYDCETNHEFVNNVIGARSIIPVIFRRGRKVHGYHRERLAKRFNHRIYHRRSLVETVFSVIKRRFDSSLQSRSLAQQNKEVGLLCVVYNVYRYVTKQISVVFCMFSTRPCQYKSRSIGNPIGPRILSSSERLK